MKYEGVIMETKARPIVEWIHGKNLKVKDVKQYGRDLQTLQLYVQALERGSWADADVKKLRRIAMEIEGE